MRKEAKEFKMKKPKSSFKNNSTPLQIPQNTNNYINNMNGVNDGHRISPEFDVEKFQNDLKSNDEMQQMYTQLVQAWQNGELRQPSYSYKNKRYNKGKSSKHKNIQENIEKNFQEGPRNIEEKIKIGDFTQKEEIKESNNLSPNMNSAEKKNYKSNSSLNSPQRYNISK